MRVATEASPDGSRLRVQDAGTGILERDLPRIFDPFFSTREREGGTGLGLSIVHGIVQEHGASIEVESEPGRGARFTVCFPLPDRSRASPAARARRHVP